MNAGFVGQSHPQILRSIKSRDLWDNTIWKSRGCKKRRNCRTKFSTNPAVAKSCGICGAKFSANPAVAKKGGICWTRLSTNPEFQGINQSVSSGTFDAIGFLWYLRCIPVMTHLPVEDVNNEKCERMDPYTWEESSAWRHCVSRRALPVWLHDYWVVRFVGADALSLTFTHICLLRAADGADGLGWTNVWCKCGFVWSWSHMMKRPPVTYCLSSCLIPTDATWWQALWTAYTILKWRFYTSQEGAWVCVSPLTLALASPSRPEHVSSGRNGFLMIKEWKMLRHIRLHEDCSCWTLESILPP